MWLVKGKNKKIKDERIGRKLGKERVEELVDQYLAYNYCDDFTKYTIERKRIYDSLIYKKKTEVGDFLLERNN